jgi:RNA-splicing ligase RtcB
LAWLTLDEADGQEYWNAMNLMGSHVAANHELIHFEKTQDSKTQDARKEKLPLNDPTNT